MEDSATVEDTNGLEFRVLGPLQVAVDGTSLPLGGAKQRAVLALLLLHANEVVPADRLIDELWGGAPPESAANMLQGYVSHLRKALEPDRLRGEHEVLVSQPPGYVLRVAPDQLDGDRFAALTEEARRLLAAGDAREARARLGEALALWRGPAFADLAYEAFAAGEIERLEELRVAALEERIDADVALGRDVVAELRELVAEHPLRERLRAQLMTALYRGGRQADALEVYRDTRNVLSEELGIEPGPTLRELERSILRQDESLGVPPLPPRVRRRRSVLTGAAVVAAAAGAVAVAGALRSTPGHPRAPLVIYPHSVAVIDPAQNAAVADILVGAYPGPLAADAAYVYVGNIGDATLSRIEPTRLVAVNDGSFSRATDLVAWNGDLWAADGGATGHTPLGVGPGTLLHYSHGPEWQTVRVGPDVTGPEEQTTLASDGRGRVVWAGNEDSATLAELDASLGRRLLTLHGIAPGGLAVVPSGEGDTVWVTDARAGLVARVDETTRRITARIHIAGRLTRIAADDRQVWVVVPEPKPALVRIDPVRARVVARIPLPLVPKRVALGAGAVWVTAYRWTNHRGAARDGELLRIDPESNRLVARIRLGDVAADGVLVAHGRVWVAVPPSA